MLWVGVISMKMGIWKGSVIINAPPFWTISYDKKEAKITEEECVNKKDDLKIHGIIKLFNIRRLGNIKAEDLDRLLKA